MPLPLLAAVAGNAAGVFSYNRANFLYDSGQRVQRYYTGLSYQMQLFNLYRQDIRDLVGLTTNKMSHYHVVAALELSMVCLMLGPARLPSAVPDWVLWHQLICLCAAFCFLVSSMWLATRAVVVAGSFNVRLQTQYIRLPLPDDEVLDAALTKAEEFESKDFMGMLRLPFLRSLWQTVSPLMPSHLVREDPELGGGRADANDPLMQMRGGGTSKHLKLYQHLQKKWTCYDAYARVTMSLGTYWLIISLSYYELGWVLCVQGRVMPAVAASSLFCGILIMLVYLDIFVSKLELALVSVLICAGPVFVGVGVFLQDGPDDLPWPSLVTGATHMLLTAWMWHIGGMVPGKTDLPAKFKGVAYLDIFGPLVRELQTVLEKTGMSFTGKAAADREAGPQKSKWAAAEARAQLQATLEQQAVSDRMEAHNLSKMVLTARNAGVDPQDEHLQAAERALERVMLPKEMRRLRQVLGDWREGQVWHHLDPGQQAIIEQMCGDLDRMLRKLHQGAWAGQSGRSSGNGGASVRSSGCNATPSTRCSGSPGVRGRSPATSFMGCAGRARSEGRWSSPSKSPAIRRTLSAESMASEYVPTWTRVSSNNGRHRDYWVGAATPGCKAGVAAELPADAHEMAFEEACELCDSLIARADRVVVSNVSTTPHAAYTGMPLSSISGLTRQGSQASFTSSQFIGDNLGNDSRKKGRRQGHHPVVAFRMLSACLLIVWFVGIFAHAMHQDFVREGLPWLFPEEDAEIADRRRLRSRGPEEPLLVVPLRWPGAFFRPKGTMLCGFGGAGGESSAAVEILASNGFELYGFGANSENPIPSRRLLCPVDVHDTLISAECSSGSSSCRAVVASEGSLWRCTRATAALRKLGAAPRPLASLSEDQLQAHGPPQVWASADPNATTLYAATREGGVMKVLRSGSLLRPVARLPRHEGAPRGLTWKALSVVADGEVLLGVATASSAAPGSPPIALAWSLLQGGPVGWWPLPPDAASAAAWCSAGSAAGDVFYASPASSPDMPASGIDWELRPWALPRQRASGEWVPGS